MAVPVPMAYTSIVSNKEHVTNDLLKLPNDVVIILDDGKVEANKNLLSVRSDFFDSSFNNPKFLESQSKRITMKGCTEAAMKALKKNYIYTGEMDFQELSLPTLLRVMNFSRQILIHWRWLLQRHRIVPHNPFGQGFSWFLLRRVSWMSHVPFGRVPWMSHVSGQFSSRQVDGTHHAYGHHQPPSRSFFTLIGSLCTILNSQMTRGLRPGIGLTK